MATESTGSILASRLAEFKQKQANQTASAATPQCLADSVRIFEPNTQPIIIKPASLSWEELETNLNKLVNLSGLMKTIKALYDQGYGAELATAAEIAQAKAKKSPIHMFATMVSKKSDNWNSITLKMVHDTWEVRRNALEVIERLKTTRR